MKKKNYNSFAIIIQARLNSSRLKNKVIKKIYKNLTVLDYLILRLSKNFDTKKIIFTLARNPKNSKIIKILKKYNLKFFEGSENNVLKRYFDCAKRFNIQNIIRITSDCPLIDPYLVKNMYKNFKRNKLDYLANTLPEKKKSYPDGSDIEVFSFKALKKMYKLNLSKHDKEHVTNKFWSTKKFKKKIYSLKIDYSQFRYSIDYDSDVKIVKFIIKKLNKSKQFGTTEEIINIINKNDKIKKLMKQNIVKQKIRRKNIF